MYPINFEIEMREKRPCDTQCMRIMPNRILVVNEGIGACNNKAVVENGDNNEGKISINGRGLLGNDVGGEALQKCGFGGMDGRELDLDAFCEHEALLSQLLVELIVWHGFYDCQTLNYLVDGLYLSLVLYIKPRLFRLTNTEIFFFIVCFWQSCRLANMKLLKNQFIYVSNLFIYF